MKKILITILFILICSVIFGQSFNSIYVVPTTTTSFGRSLPQGQLILCSGDSTLYMLTSAATSTKKITTADVYQVSGTVAVDTTSVWDASGNYLHPSDTTDSVAIGHQNPVMALDVWGSALIWGDAFVVGTLDVDSLVVPRVDSARVAVTGWNAYGFQTKDTSYFARLNQSNVFSGTLQTFNNVEIHGATTIIGNTIVVGGLTLYEKLGTYNNGDSLLMTTGISGFGTIFSDTAGTTKAWARFYFDANGTVSLIDISSGVVTTNTAGKEICIFDNGSGICIKNRSGYTRRFKIDIRY